MFTLAATTDYVDGYLARNWQQQSLFGRWLDPVADKLLVASAVVMLVGFDRAPLLPSLVILLREITVSGLREYMAEVSVGLPVSRLAKWKTAVQMTAIGFLLVGSAGPGLAAGRGDRLVGAVARGHPDAGHRLGLSAGGPAPHAPGPPRRHAGEGARARLSRQLIGEAHEGPLFRLAQAARRLRRGDARSAAGGRQRRRAQDLARPIAIAGFAEALASPGVVRCAVNQEYVPEDAPLRAGRRGRVLPAGDGRLTWSASRPSRSTSAPSSAGSASGRTDIGAVASFVGLVRDEHGGAARHRHDAGALSRHDRAAAARLEAEAQRRWPLLDSLVVHRVGRMLPGEPIVLVATASAHRHAALDACAFLIDWLKTEAPFWKLEETPAGERWVDARAGDDAAAARWRQPVG